MPPAKKKRKGTKTNTSNVDEQAVFEEAPAVGANVVAAAVTQMSQDTAVDESPRRRSPRRSKTSTTASQDTAVDESPRRRSPRRSKTSTTASSLSNNGDNGGAERQQEEAGAGGQEEEATRESTVAKGQFLGNNSYAEVYANNPSEAYTQLYLLLYPRPPPV
eukprot:scaffold9783_cov52-Cyclotella_meneghiniana.AAC.2